MAGRGRPRKDPILGKYGVNEKPEKPTAAESRRLLEQAKEIERIINSYDQEKGAIKAKEMVFANLVAAEGFTLTDAYIQAYNPGEDVKDKSVCEMASRLSRKPVVAAEIESIKCKLAEEAMAKEGRLISALDGKKVSERIAIELYAIATSPSTDSKLKLSALKTLGEMRHVDCFTSSTSVNTNIVNGSLGIDNSAPVSEARNMLASNVKKLLAARQPEAIEV